MPRTGRVRSRSQVNPALILLAVLGILTMPVDYRADAAIPHPHATVQLLGDVARGSLDHHGNLVDSLGHLHGDRHHWHRGQPRHASPSNVAPLLPGRDDSIHWSATRALCTGLGRHLMVGAPHGKATIDEPTLSPRTGGSTYIAFTVLLPTIAVIFVRWLLQPVVWAAAATWNGVSHLPELPPPRLA